MIDKIRAQVARYSERYPLDMPRARPLVEQLISGNENILQRSNMLGHITTSMFVLSQNFTCGLVVSHLQLQMWLQPGGHYEGDETLVKSALREVVEETGIQGVTMLSATPIDIDCHPVPASVKKAEAAHMHHDFCYLGWGSRDSALIPQDSEVAAVKWMPLTTLAKGDPRMQILVTKAQKFLADRRLNMA